MPDSQMLLLHSLYTLARVKFKQSRVFTDRTAYIVFTSVPSLLVHTNATTATIFVRAPRLLVLADFCAGSLCTCSSLVGARRSGCRRSLYTCSLATDQCRDCGGSSFCKHKTVAAAASASFAGTRRFGCPTLFQLLRRRWCLQRPLPPRILHLLLCQWCSQRPLPLQGRHVLLCCFCTQRLLPPQSLPLLLSR